MFDFEYLIEEIRVELYAADLKHPRMAEPQEGVETLKCEVQELNREVYRAEKEPGAMRKEALQCAAMCIKFLRDCCHDDQ